MYEKLFGLCKTFDFPSNQEHSRMLQYNNMFMEIQLRLLVGQWTSMQLGRNCLITVFSLQKHNNQLFQMSVCYLVPHYGQRFFSVMSISLCSYIIMHFLCSSLNLHNIIKVIKETTLWSHFERPVNLSLKLYIRISYQDLCTLKC
jgi:hypothetical protein